MSWGRGSSKYGARRVSFDNYSFASKLEAAVYQLLKLELLAGEIIGIQVQDRVKLTDAEIVYIPDFKCERPDGTFFHAEAKGLETSDWKIKLRLWRYYGPGELKIYKGSWQRPKLVETVIPQKQPV